MPLPRKLSPRRRERRSRSRSPRNRRRSRSRSRSRDRRRSRSRSAQRRRSPERKRSPIRRRSPSPRKRSRSPRRRSHSSRRSRSHSPRRRSRSHSPRRRGSPPRRRSTSPADKIYPVKRPADSSVKRQSYRSRSRSESPAPVKKPRDERLYREESPHEKQRPSRRSTSPAYRSPYSGKMYADNPPSSRQPLFPAGTSKRAAAEIDYVTIVEKGPKKEKLNKRFETLEQAARGPFDFEENITIGIHRGPQHIQLDGDEDIEVNYDFNPKTFKMLFPKKDYVKAIFDRDEIKAFHHDDILDEEAYVEKRTISIKPVDKPKSRKYNEEMDYKITVGTGREGYGDRRMVHDSGSRQRPSRSSGYEDIPVTVRLDPKPDPRYEKMYREQQRFEDHALMHEKVNRDPNDLRYNLMRRRSDGERGHDSRDAPSGAMDARSRIEARRQESRDYGDRRDRPDGRRGTRVSPQRSADRKKTTFVKTDLPDFKNRPGVKLEKPVVWIVGSSVVKDVSQFGRAFPEYDLATMLKDDVSAVFIHGEIDMKIEDMLPAVKYMLKTTERPHMIVFQCGEHNVCVGRNADLIEVVKKDLAVIKQEIPGVVLVWSQMLPPWMAEDQTGSTLAKSRRRINTFMMQCFLSEEIGGAFLYHSMLRTNLKQKYYMKTSDGFLHLKKKGMKIYIDQLEVGIRYLMTGHGSIFPYLKWPQHREQLTQIEPECMCMLNKEQLQSLDNGKFASFSMKQIQGLSSKQILMFHKNQLHFVFCKDFISKLSEKQLEGLTKKHVMHLNNLQISYFLKQDRFMFVRKEVQDFIKKKVKVNAKVCKGRGETLTEFERERKNETKQGENLSDSVSESGESEKEWEEEFERCGSPGKECRYRSYSRKSESRYLIGSADKNRSKSNDRGRRVRKNSLRERYRSRSGSRNRYRSYSRERDRSLSRERYRRSSSRERHRRHSHSSERSDRSRNHSSGNFHHGLVQYSPVVPHPGMIPAFHPPPNGSHPFPQMLYPACPPFPPASRPPFGLVPFTGAYSGGPPPLPWSAVSDGAQAAMNSSLEVPSERSAVNTRGSGFVSHDDRHGDVRSKWGHCSICNIPLSSEQHALDHVNSEQHQANEDAQRYRSSPARQIRCRDNRERVESSRRDHLARVYVDESADRKRHLSTDSDFDPRDMKRRSISKEFERISDDELDKQMFSGSTEQYPENDVMRSPASELDAKNTADTVLSSQARDAQKLAAKVRWLLNTEKFKPEPEWKINPTITPKGQSYYEHDNRSRDDMTFWERKQMFLKTGRYPSFRGGRGGIVRGRGRGRGIDQGFMKKTIGAAMDEWKHDKFDEVSADENNSPSKDKKEEKDIKKDKKGSRKDKDDKNSKRESSSKKGKESSSRKEKESSSKKELESSFRRSSEMAKDQETIRQEEESLQHELKVEVTIGE